MSFLQDILTSAGQTELIDLKNRISDVTSSISQLKVRIYDYLKSKFVDFEPLLKTDQNYVEQATRLSQEMTALFNRIEAQTKVDLANSTAELRLLDKALKENSLMLSISSDLVNVDRTFTEAKEAINSNRFLDAAKAYLHLENLLKTSFPDDLLDICKTMRGEYQLCLENFCFERTRSLYSFISWEKIDADENTTQYSLKIVTHDVEALVENAKALHVVNMLTPWISKLQTSLMRFAFLPIMEFESSVSVVDGERSSTLNVEVHNKFRNCNCLDILTKLTQCFEFIHGELDITLEDGDTFVSLLGTGISEEFSNNLVTKSLKDTVPSSPANDKFMEVLQKAEKFHIYLSGIGFIPEDDARILDFVRNVDVLCSNKACEIYLSKAREIMKKDLQDMIKVKPEAPASPITDVNISVTLNINEALIHSETKGNMIHEGEPIPNLFQFPVCCVSKSSLEILDLVKDLLIEAKSSQCEKNGTPLFNTARSIFYLYMAVVPTYHQKLLSTIPQQVALFHNSCMYIAHRLLTLGFEMGTCLNDDPESPRVATFVDVVVPLRDLGTSSLLKHMQFQRKQILDIVQNSGLASLGQNPNLSPDTEKSLRQCLRQLELLKEVWHGILPANVYNKSIGLLVNAFIEELVVRVTCVEDIPADTATDLASLFVIVSKCIPGLFLDECEVVLHVKRWLKFQELIQVLKASLREIEERWADGKGPLAQEFSVEQVKQLIRALFQNTKRRAEVLTRIR